MINISKFFNSDNYNRDNSDGAQSSSNSREQDTRELPLLPLRDMVLFPNTVSPVFVGRTKSINALAQAMGKDKHIFLVTQSSPDIIKPKINEIYQTGTEATISQILKLPDGTVKVVVEGLSRGRVSSIHDREAGYMVVKFFSFIETEMDKSLAEASIRAVAEAFSNYAKQSGSIPKNLLQNLITLSDDPSRFSDTIAAHMPFKLSDKQKLLDTASLEERFMLLLKLIEEEIEVFAMSQKIKGRVKEQMEKLQKKHYLNEQMRAIRKEMGEEPEPQQEFKLLESQVKRKKLPKEAASVIRQELEKFKKMSPMSSEATVVRNYIEWILALPWYKKSRGKIDIDNAEAILNKDHYGLDKPKERILEYLAVQMLVKKIKGPILCLVGPPGVGKTSLARSVANAMGRSFARISLGGVRDEAEIRGHRRTYIGAMPGKIIQTLKKTGYSNPVFCLDEIDKMSTDFRGDPSSALLEVLDPEQNQTFNDHYLDIAYDLSDILFITTANTLHDIPAPLQDRMEIIRIPGYTENEKEQIAHGFLIPKQIELNGLSFLIPQQSKQFKQEQSTLIVQNNDKLNDKLNLNNDKSDLIPTASSNTNINISGTDFDLFSKDAVLTIIRKYTREAGVRNLEREISSVLRKVAKRIVQTKGKIAERENSSYASEETSSSKTEETIKADTNTIEPITSESLVNYLGKPKFRNGVLEKEDKIGIVNGLAWTQAGGELLTIESVTMPGKGNVSVTGKLGEVMKESASAAMSYVRSRSAALGIRQDFYKDLDIHIHVPEGAIPKDGPSAGIAMCTALVSVLTERPVKRTTAMTGEITLRGSVIPIGGLKEKLIAAHACGIKTVIISKENEKDISDIPTSIQDELQIVLVEDMEEVLATALSDKAIIQAEI